MVGDARKVLKELDDQSVHCAITSPPYWGLRGYGREPGMIGLEPTFDEHLSNLREVFSEVFRVLRDDGTLWLNYGDAYAGSGKGVGTKEWSPMQGGNKGTHDLRKTPDFYGLKPKNLMMMPARIAMALQEDGWTLRSEIIWHKTSCMPESVKDRPTSSHEKIFLLSKGTKYYYDADAVRTPHSESSLGRYEYGHNSKAPNDGFHSAGSESGAFKTDRMGKHVNMTGANLRNVWRFAPAMFKDAHYATFPEELVIRCLKAGCPVPGVALDPFGGAGTVGLVADKLNRDAIIIEINEEYAKMARQRIMGDAPLFSEVK